MASSDPSSNLFSIIFNVLLNKLSLLRCLPWVDITVESGRKEIKTNHYLIAAQVSQEADRKSVV